MINTLQIKQQQLSKGFYSTGTGSEILFIMGSCRAVPYLTYFKDWNVINNNRFTICFIDPFNWCWNMKEERVDYEAELIKQETNNELLTMLKGCSIFVHEHYGNAQMFNVNKEAEKNIYQFGINPTIDICLPNFNDIFLLTKDIVSFTPEILKAALQDFNVNGRLSPETLKEIESVRNHNMQRFEDICYKTDFPEFADIFKNKHKSVRFNWTFNHVSKEFTQALFYLMNNKFLKLPMDNYKLTDEDLFANNYTFLCEYDEYQWPNETRKNLRDML